MEYSLLKQNYVYTLIKEYYQTIYIKNGKSFDYNAFHHRLRRLFCSCFPSTSNLQDRMYIAYISMNLRPDIFDHMAKKFIDTIDGVEPSEKASFVKSVSKFLFAALMRDLDDV